MVILLIEKYYDEVMNPVFDCFLWFFVVGEDIDFVYSWILDDRKKGTGGE